MAYPTLSEAVPHATTVEALRLIEELEIATRYYVSRALNACEDYSGIKNVELSTLVKDSVNGLTRTLCTAMLDGDWRGVPIDD